MNKLRMKRREYRHILHRAALLTVDLKRSQTHWDRIAKEHAIGIKRHGVLLGDEVVREQWIGYLCETSANAYSELYHLSQAYMQKYGVTHSYKRHDGSDVDIWMLDHGIVLPQINAHHELFQK